MIIELAKKEPKRDKKDIKETWRATLNLSNPKKDTRKIIGAKNTSQTSDRQGGELLSARMRPKGSPKLYCTHSKKFIRKTEPGRKVNA